jgi:hypothetical protein
MKAVSFALSAASVLSRSAEPASLSGYTTLFVVTALAFEVLIIATLIAEKRQRHRLVRTLGILWALLAIPLAIVFVHDLTVGSDRWVVLSFGLIFLYMTVEIAFDFVLRIPFRERPVLHIPYIILEYGALFGLIRIAFVIGPTWGYLISVGFWLLLAAVIVVSWDQITGRKRRAV